MGQTALHRGRQISQPTCCPRMLLLGIYHLNEFLGTTEIWFPFSTVGKHKNKNMQGEERERRRNVSHSHTSLPLDLQLLEAELSMRGGLWGDLLLLLSLSLNSSTRSHHLSGWRAHLCSRWGLNSWVSLCIPFSSPSHCICPPFLEMPHLRCKSLIMLE